jgi:hypothetical protein
VLVKEKRKVFMEFYRSVFGLYFSYFPDFFKDELSVVFFLFDAFEFLVKPLSRNPKDFG